ncbi:ligase-associated DNA damage response exonuclease [Alteromonas sp. W409]|uniref:Ligase-associated DNA damage response exonuclease n=2 Tax=Brumicola blandensis TaxID=3075611 RepID=A0AAW8R2Y4_9ALTE|nr:ligase-associated DNA damage response exonuclease [Alteromonas sp. W409]MDT0583547.1 ligase-associated DNA damage response exonuclease [Alteromonas sp. W409]
MQHPQHWITTNPNGLYCEALDAYIDPMQAVARAIVTHGHADHARAGHGEVYATPETMAIMRIRYGEDHAQKQIELAYDQTIDLAKGQLMLKPAGHILGSAQAVIDHASHRLVISGDYKRSADPTCAPFEVCPCDVFVTEATFALPVFHHPPILQEVNKLLDSLSLFPERCHLVGVYALGKCQRVVLALRELGYQKPIYMHGALLKLCTLYKEFGIDMGAIVPVSEVEDTKTLAGEIVLAPPSALNDRWSRKLPNVITAMASGWMQIRARSKQRKAELPIIISDHCDWPELLQTISEVNPGEVWVTHGREAALVHQAQQMGYRAKALSLVGFDEEAAE